MLDEPTGIRDYYRENKWWNTVRTAMHEDLYDEITRNGPVDVFELGYGGGKNLAALEVKGCRGWGFDVNVEGWKEAVGKGLSRVMVGSDADLWRFSERAFGVAFTCSVLNHLPNGLEVLEQLKRIAHRVVVCEAMELPVAAGDPNWWAHPYPLTRVKGPYVSSLWANVPYGIWT